MTKPTQETSFWQKRLEHSPSILDAMGTGFNWNFLDSIHKPVIDQFVPVGSRILDVACGPGRTAHWWGDEQYVGIDFFEPFVSEAKRLHPRKKFLLCDIVKDDLPFEDRQFDWAILISVKVVIGPAIGWAAWNDVEWKLRRVVKQGILIFEYGNNIKEEAEKFELLRPYA